MSRKSPAGYSGKSRRADYIRVAALIILSALFLAPLIWMFSTALKPLDQTMSNPPQWIPHPAQWGNFGAAMSYGEKQLGYVPFLVYGRNTLAVAILTVAGSLVSNTLVAYAFARLNWKGRDLFFSLTLASMMIPFPVLMVPLYTLFKHLGWIGGFRPLWVPAFLGNAFFIYLLRQFFKTIPFELTEAAKIDGCSEFRIFRDIVLPLSKPAIAVVALFTFMGAWNDFLGPLIYLTDQKTFTLALGLQFFQNEHTGTPWNLLMAATVVVVLPVLVVFFLAQKTFIQGIASTGGK